ncbi:MAG: TerB N-terminal domain-containing protein [Pseudomonadota bacterium]
MPRFTIEVRYGEHDEDDDHLPNANVTAQSCWVPAGTSRTLCGVTITKGRIFMGSGLAAGNGFSVEPALVNPDLTVESGRTDLQDYELGYWPQYHRIGPQTRAGYLQYLATDRDDPETPIGFVFLYFYGLERRLLVDAIDPGFDEAEYRDLIAEIERLLTVYDHSRSFRGYANGLLDFLRIRGASLDQPGEPPVVNEYAPHVPLSLQVDLGIFSINQRPIPAEWAYAWIMQDPQFQFRQRKVAERCTGEFRELFKALYRERYGDGIVVKPNKTMIKAEYHPASPGLRHVSEPLELPNISILKGPTKKLATLIDTCCEKLASYSRFIGRSPERKESLEALSLLPAELSALRKSDDVAVLESTLRQRLYGQAFCRVSFSELTLDEAFSSASKPSAKSMRGLTSFLEKSGIGLEPDVRYTGAVPDLEGDCILFAVQGASELPPSEDFEHAVVVMRLAGFVLYGQADSLTDRHTAVIDDFLGGFSSLTSLETQHLKAYFFWEMGRKSTLAGMRKRVDGMSHEDRTELEQVLVRLASADGVVDTHELKKLRRTASLLGRDPEALYSQIHSAMAEPTLVRPARVNATGFRIPAPPAEPDPASSKRKPLDAEAIQHKRQETEHISDVLHGIFGEQTSPREGDRTAAPRGEKPQEILDGASEAPAEEDSTTAGHIGGLDAAHLSLLVAIAQEADGLPRGEAEAMAAELKLMLAGALDRINEAAFEITDALVIEETGGALVVDNEILEEMRG